MAKRTQTCAVCGGKAGYLNPLRPSLLPGKFIHVACPDPKVETAETTDKAVEALIDHVDFDESIIDHLDLRDPIIDLVRAHVPEEALDEIKDKVWAHLAAKLLPFLKDAKAKAQAVGDAVTNEREAWDQEGK